MPKPTPWTSDDLPDLSGRTMIVTGANSGIGFEATRELARKGAHVVLACRDMARTEERVRALRTEHPRARVEAMELDLASLASVHAFAGTFLAAHRELHVLCNNAGVMALPYVRTADGFEMQLGTNHLGHFALTGLLLDRLLSTPGARVVTVSSGAHRIGRIRFDDLHGERRYRKWLAYAQSKLANLLFAFELERRFEAAGANTISVACHPGYAATNLQLAGPRMAGSAMMESLSRLSNRIFAQSAAMGALPILYAAAAREVRGGQFVGPDGPGEVWGHPTRVRPSRRARDRRVARRLWQVSEHLTGVRYEALPSA